MKIVKKELTLKDDVLIINTAYKFKSGDEYVIASPDISIKDVTNASVKLNALISGIAYKANSVNLMLDLSNKISAKGVDEFTPDEFGATIDSTLNAANNHAVLTFESTTKGNFFNSINEAFNDVNDYDRNFNVDIKEVSGFLNKKSSTTFHSKGRRIPLFLSSKFVLEE